MILPLLATGLVLVAAHAAPPTHAVGLEPENARLAARVGVWDVVETEGEFGGTGPGKPKVSRLVAERRMVGAFLQETLRPSLDSKTVLRMDYLSFHAREGRWKYVSMDTRHPVGIMSAASFGRGERNRIDVTFEPLSVPGTGQLLQMNQVYVILDADHDRKEQRFVAADGTGRTSLSHLYAYTRRRTRR